MNILLVYPEFPDTFWSFKHALRFIRKKAGAPPLGLLTVAAMLPAAWEKRLVDLNAIGLSQRDLLWADYVFISAMVVQRDAARALIARCKEAGVKVVAGGPLFTMEYAEFPEVDHFVLNEAELTLPPFLSDLANGCARHLYTTTEYPDIRQTPAPLWQLADLKQYETVSIQFSRGCPFNCNFCNVTALLGHRPRTKTAPQIIAELDSLYALGWRKGVFFVDDNFIGNKRQLKAEILPALITWRKGKIGMPFNTEVSINLADDPELMTLMTQAGFETIFVGIETPNEDSLAECSKTQNKGRDLVDSVKRLQRAGLQVQGGFIVGFDNDTPNQDLPGSAVSPGPGTLHLSVGYPRERACPLLETLFLDTVPPATPFPVGHHAGGLRLSLPAGDCITCRVRRSQAHGYEKVGIRERAH